MSKRTENVRFLTRQMRRQDSAREIRATVETQNAQTIPSNRGGCLQIPRPCPFVSCRHHLSLDVSANGSLRWREQDDTLTGGLAGAEATNCSLDIAAEGGHTLTEIAALLGCTRERIRQEHDAALQKLKACADLESGHIDGIAHVDYIPSPEQSHSTPVVGKDEDPWTRKLWRNAMLSAQEP